MVKGGSIRTGPARRGPGWRAWLAVLVMALVGAASVAEVWHEEASAEQDCCAVCQLRHQPADEPAESLYVGPADAPRAFDPAFVGGWIDSGHSHRLPARGPPA